MNRAMPLATTRMLAIAAVVAVAALQTIPPALAARSGRSAVPVPEAAKSARSERISLRSGGTGKAAPVTMSKADVAADAAAREQANQNAIGIVSGNPNGTYLTAAYDLSAVLDDGEALRLLPILGKGGAQNVRDVLYLRGVDVGITQTAIVNRLRRTKELGDIDGKIVYIARLFNEELHILARPEIQTVLDLMGKTVNFSDVGSGTQLNAREIFQALGVDAREVNMGQADAIEKMRSGEIAATVLVAGKPAGAFAKLKREGGLHFLPLEYGKPFEESYFPAAITSEDYPGLLAPGERVNTVAAAAVLIAYNWREDNERYKKLERFVDAFFTKFPELLKAPRHPKWQEVNVGAILPGWNRLAAAQRWLDRAHSANLAEKSGEERSVLRASFDQFMAKNNAAKPGDSDRMFEEFLRWRERQVGQ